MRESEAAMNRDQARDARVIEQMTRWTLVMLQNAERGLVPVRALQRTVDPAVLAAFGPVAPPSAGSRARVHVGGVRIHLVNSGLAHVAATGLRPDGQRAGYVLEFRSDFERRQWRVTELTRVEDRNLVPPGSRAGVVKAATEEPRRYPADLARAIDAAEAARTAALGKLAVAQAEADELKSGVDAIRGRGPRMLRERAALVAKERQAQADVARWDRAVTKIDHELQTLHEVRELREVRHLVIDGDPLVRARKPEYLDRLLGPVPKERDDRAKWRQAASTVERYRQQWGITDREDALGPVAQGMPPEQQRHHREAAEAAARYVSRRGIDLARTTDAHEALDLSL